MNDADFLGRGWAFPPTFAAGGANVEMVSGVADIRQSLQIMFNTVPGERVMQDAFGCDLPRLVFRELDQSLINAITKYVNTAILDYEARIVADKVDVNRSADDPGCLLICVYYTVKATNARYNLVFPFYLTEATLLSGA